jgi:hypothetical protein
MVSQGAPLGEPVHNVPLLVLAETGVGGSAAVIAFGLAILAVAWGRRGLNRTGSIVSAALISLLSLSLFDHFLWSQSTGRLWFALVFGLWLSKITLRVDQPQFAGAPVEETK